MPKYEFSSIAEIMEFVGCLTAKAKKSGKGESGDESDTGASAGGGAPAPIMPPTAPSGAASGFPGGAQGFAAPGAGAGQAGAFPAAAAPQIAPEVAAWVAKISGVIDATANTDRGPAMLNWFRTSCGAGAENASFEQIKTHFLPKFTAQQLADMGKLMGLT